MGKKNFDNTVFIFFCLLIIALPIAKSILSIATSVLFGLALIVGIFYWKDFSFRKHSQLWVFALLPVALIWSLIYSDNFEGGLIYVFKQNTFLAFPLIFTVFSKHIGENINLYLKLFVRTISAAAAFTLILYALPEDAVIAIVNNTFDQLQEYHVHKTRTTFGLYSPFIDRLHFTNMIGVALFISIRNLFSSGRFKTEIIFILLLFTALVLIGGRASQGAFLISLFATGIIYIIIKKRSTIIKYSRYAIITLILTISLPIVIFKTVPAVQERYNQLFWELKLINSGEYKEWSYQHFTSLTRIMSTKNMWQLSKDHPYLGVGIGDYQVEMNKVYEQDGLGMKVNSHNQYLFYWACSGILGLMILLFALGYWVFTLNFDDLWGFVGLAFILFFMIIFMFGIDLNYMLGSTLFMLSLGLLHKMIHP